MNTSFRKMSNRLKKSVIELEKMAKQDLSDEMVRFELQIKFNEISKIVSILEDMLWQNSIKEEASLLTE